jgi:hypothetical protein
MTGGIFSLESLPQLLESLKIPSLKSEKDTKNEENRRGVDDIPSFVLTILRVGRLNSFMHIQYCSVKK